MISLNGWVLQHQNGIPELTKNNWKILVTNTNDCSLDFNGKYIKDKLNLEEAVKFIEEIKIGIIMYNRNYIPVLYIDNDEETIEYIELNDNSVEIIECHKSLLVVI